MILHILLEVGGLSGIVFGVILIFGGGAFLLSLLVAFIFKVIYESSSKKKMTQSHFWLIVFVCLSIFGLIAGAICR